MNRALVFMLGLIYFSPFAFAQNELNKNKDSSIKVFSDNPLVAYFDSLLIENLSFTEEELKEIDLYAEEESLNLWAKSAEL